MKGQKGTFPKSARILSKDDFSRVFNGSKNPSSDRFFIVLSRFNGGKVARLGLAISRKCAPRAVDRNRIKRLIRERFRMIRHRLYGTDVVVLCRRGTATKKNCVLSASLYLHFNNIRSNP